MGPRPDQPRERRSRGFERAAGLVSGRVRKAGEGRGFAVSRVLTQWAEIVGPELAAMARPVKVSYGREGFGATLVLLTSGAAAPLVQMRLPDIREKVNACYGYAAISHLRVTQSAAEGFAEPAADFLHAPAADTKRNPPRPETAAEAARVAADVDDPGLKAALATLALNVLSKDR